MSLSYLDKTGLAALWAKIKAKFVSDEFYVHTDNNYTTEEKAKLSILNEDRYVKYADSTIEFKGGSSLELSMKFRDALGTRNGEFLRISNEDANGHTVGLGGGGLTFVGGGEAMQNLITDSNYLNYGIPFGEHLVLAADNNVYIASDFSGSDTGLITFSNGYAYFNRSDLATSGSNIAYFNANGRLSRSGNNLVSLKTSTPSSFANKSVATGVGWANLGSFSFPAGGLYLVLFTVRWDEITTGSSITAGKGYRKTCISTTSTGGSASNQHLCLGPSTPSDDTVQEMVAVINTTSETADHTYYFNAGQTSGYSMTAMGRYTIIQLA